MEITPSYIDTKKAIADQLISMGWSAVGDFDMQCTAAVASKDYSTAVGTKTAFAYLQPADEGDFNLVGAYYSQGNNVLSTTCVAIEQAMTPDAVIQQAKAYAGAVDEAVGATYAMTLKSAAQKSAACRAA